MHDKLKNEDSVNDVNNRLNEYFNLENLNLEDISEEKDILDEND